MIYVYIYIYIYIYTCMQTIVSVDSFVKFANAGVICQLSVTTYRVGTLLTKDVLELLVNYCDL